MVREPWNCSNNSTPNMDRRNLLRRVIEAPTRGEAQDELTRLTRSTPEDPTAFTLDDVDEILANATPVRQAGDETLVSHARRIFAEAL
jgi:hypothetical protein